jgi:cell wall-associated NlpC family hydrolase
VAIELGGRLPLDGDKRASRGLRTATAQRTEDYAAAPGPIAATGLPATATLTDSIVATATAVMGRPYRYGGPGVDSSGFDCSGQIQYAFGAHGITLPRRSVDQAKQGREVPKRLDQLRPGDLLTFSNRRGPVTHVGLYLGDKRFVHSATRGVQVSVLSGADPYGRWWFDRWVGVRRIVD